MNLKAVEYLCKLAAHCIGKGGRVGVDWRLGIGLFGTDVMRRSSKT